MMSKILKILFLGDLVGRPGREAVQKFLNNEITTESLVDKGAGLCIPLQLSCAENEFVAAGDFDFIIANVENASHGFGLTAKNHDELLNCGIGCMTSGNHIWDKKDIYTYIDDSCAIVRSINYHKTARGTGYRIFYDKIIVINILGKTFMQPAICPFQSLFDTLSAIKQEIDIKDKIIIVDFHAEATAEKICFAHFAYSLGVSAVFGTHTHVQTADERLIDTCLPLSEDFKCFDCAACGFIPKEKMAYITDAGFCGSYESVIGMEYESSLKKLVTSIPERFDVAGGELRQINAVCVGFNPETGSAEGISRINFIYKENQRLET